ncbi:uncharacterized protein MYCFIDRAFT_134041 [Pseudocercospora fijiensis CIRAD86]|uniref:Ribonucleotide reductase large subunit domain-containing protein n=1 Tax=Pseudocercospora fijiensis (strain CIRAD86) TaxID=383855 RepID=M3B5L3_PSEFD|nr:uncharacterized protein MYCFIDRAFT_134041 [Pseudocercospora fijiensis CIRAD86]EME84643.1 hypothetical protein MYCFIDRAFT_134041 [Pseudocercospora fijiensis CIRAD86]
MSAFKSASTSNSASFWPILPPSYPLGVRNSYLSAWMPGNKATDLPSSAPKFWNGQQLGWSVMARVDEKGYSLFGVPSAGKDVTPGSVRGATYTTTHSSFFVDAGSATFILDFFSPVAPNNYVRHSLPFSYLTVSASAKDGKRHSVQIYSDMDSSWTGHFEEDDDMIWNSTTRANSTTVMALASVASVNGAPFSEVNDMAQWGTAVYCSRPNGGDANALTHAVGELGRTRNDFIRHGEMRGDGDISTTWQPGAGLAFSYDMDSIETTRNATFVIGHVRDPDLNYLGDSRRSYWKSACDDDNWIACGCDLALNDFAAADAESRAFDSAIAANAESVGGSKYSDILQLSVRQTFGAMDMTVSNDLNTSDVMIFQKGISSNGNVNKVDVIFRLSPILYVVAPEWIRLLAEPVMRYLASGRWGFSFTIHDIGSHYPNVTGHDDGFAEPTPLEECGDMILLAYMYQTATGDTDWTAQYSSLFQSYADYLVEGGLYPSDQVSSDDDAGASANQTSLAMKSAIALNAFGRMTAQTDYSDVGLQFADVLYNQGAGLDSDRTHFTLVQGEDESWTTAYNLYIDVLLNLETFPSEAYTLQSAYYTSVRSEAGVALDSRVSWGKTDWMLWAAAVAQQSGNEDVRDMFVDDVHAFISNGQSDKPFGDRFFVGNSGGDEAGTWDSYRARPVVGGLFALLALNGPTMWLGDAEQGNE